MFRDTDGTEEGGGIPSPPNVLFLVGAEAGDRVVPPYRFPQQLNHITPLTKSVFKCSEVAPRKSSLDLAQPINNSCYAEQKHAMGVAQH